MMTGFHQNYIRAHQHRTHEKHPLPHGIRPIPHLMRDAGYYTALLSRKTDCNFIPTEKSELFEGDDWSGRAEGQPFFARITFGGTHRSWNRDPERPIDIADVDVGTNIGAQLQTDQAEADTKRYQAEAEQRRALAIAHEAEHNADAAKNRALVILAEAEVPKAMSQAFRDGNLGIMDHYRMQNVVADTAMRNTVAEGDENAEG